MASFDKVTNMQIFYRFAFASVLCLQVAVVQAEKDALPQIKLDIQMGDISLTQMHVQIVHLPEEHSSTHTSLVQSLLNDKPITYTSGQFSYAGQTYTVTPFLFSGQRLMLSLEVYDQEKHEALTERPHLAMLELKHEKTAHFGLGSTTAEGEELDLRISPELLMGAHTEPSQSAGSLSHR